MSHLDIYLLRLIITSTELWIQHQLTYLAALLMANYTTLRTHQSMNVRVVNMFSWSYLV